jgi:predicted regulator of Ras-like GTPase activity (Roadblock/LC7/MglB family)
LDKSLKNNPEGNMVEDFRSRMGDLRQEIDRIASQAEDMERVVQEQQVRLEEMDLLMRQRDEQLAEQQAHVEELEATLRGQDEELAALRAQLAEKEESLAERDQEVTALQARLAEYEANEAVLREELAQLRRAPVPVEVPIQPVLERFAVLESLVGRQGDSLVTLRSLVEEEMARLHGRIDQLEAHLLAAPPAIPTPAAIAVAPPVEAAPPAEVAAPGEAAPPAEVAAPGEAAPPAEVAAPGEAAPPAEVAAPGEKVSPPVVSLPVSEADSLQSLLQDTLDMLPAAAMVGLAGRDGLTVEMLVRRELAFAQPLELGLADLTTEAVRVAEALNTGPLLTVAFQAGEEHVLLTPVGGDHFVYLLTPVDSAANFQQAQAVLLQAVSRLNELD